MEVLDMRKKCYRCKKTKSIEKFSRNKSRSDGYSSSCKKCHSVLRREHYLKNKDKIRKQVKIQKKAYVKWLRSLKDGPCVDCNIKYPYYVMQFDHRDPKEKEFNIGSMLSLNYNKERVLREVDKCDLVCANCHAERTHKRRD
jgi:hypothetical protein